MPREDRYRNLTMGLAANLAPAQRPVTQGEMIERLVPIDRERLVRLNDPALYENYPDVGDRERARNQIAQSMISPQQVNAAQNAGFDASKVLYHATHRPWMSGEPDFSRRNWNTMEWGDGLYMTPSIGLALRYARQSFEDDSPIPDRAVLMPFVLRRDIKLFKFGDDSYKRGQRGKLADSTGVTRELKAKGYDGGSNQNGSQIVVWNTEKARHVGARFDAAKKSSTDVFA